MDSDFEKAKRELKLVESHISAYEHPAIRQGFMPTLRCIPFLGDLLSTTIEASLTEFQKEKQELLLSAILSSPREITSEMVNDVEFLINFARTHDAVNRLGANDKVKYFGTLLKHCYFRTKKMPTANDCFEEFADALTRLSYREIRTLVWLYKCEQFVRANDAQAAESELAEARAARIQLEKIFADNGLRIDSISALLSQLTRTGYVHIVAGAYYNYSGDQFHSSESLKQFVELIDDGNDPESNLHH